MDKTSHSIDVKDSALITMVTDSSESGRHRSSDFDLHNNPNPPSDSAIDTSHVPHMADSNDSGGKDNMISDQQQPYVLKRQSSRTAKQQDYDHQSHNYSNQVIYMNHSSPVDVYSQSQCTIKLSGQAHIHGSGISQAHIPTIVKSGKRMQVKNACTNCQKACKKCDDARPCSRCIKYNMTDTCVNSTRKERVKGLKRGPYKRREEDFHDMTHTLSFQKISHGHEYQPQYHIGSQPFSKFHSIDDNPTISSIVSGHSAMTKLPSLSELQLSLRRPIYRESPISNQSIPLQSTSIPARHQLFMNSNDHYQSIYDTYQGSGSGSLSYQDPRLQSISGLNNDSILNSRNILNRGLPDAHLDYLTASKTLYRPTPLSTPLTMFPGASQRPATPEYYRLGSDLQNQPINASILTSSIGNYRTLSSNSLYTQDKHIQLNTLSPITLPPLKLPKDYSSNNETLRGYDERSGRNLVSSRLDELSDLCSIIGPSN